MKRIFILLYSLLLSLFHINSLAANVFNESQIEKNDLSILELLPDLNFPLAVAPEIPSNFTALSPDGVLNPCDWIYWGPKDVLQAYFANPSSLKTPILRVKLSANVAQTGPHSFNNGEAKQYFEMLKNQDPKDFDFRETEWRDYPVFAAKTKVEGHIVYMAWVGLNDPEGGWTLMFNLVYPEKSGHPNIEDLELWENFIAKTTKLSDQDYFKACGQDLQEGYTVVNTCGAKLKVIAEKRESDGVLQIVVIPENSDVEFRYFDMKEGLMSAKWKNGEPLLKVRGEIVMKQKILPLS